MIPPGLASTRWAMRWPRWRGSGVISEIASPWAIEGEAVGTSPTSRGVHIVERLLDDPPSGPGQPGVILDGLQAAEIQVAQTGELPVQLIERHGRETGRRRVSELLSRVMHP